jgi:type I restriction enzyme, R subunit
MAAKPEAEAREKIDAALAEAGWCVQDANGVNLFAGRGVAVREFPLKQGHGFADYLLFVDRRAIGVVEAKPVGSTLTGVEIQSTMYSQGLPDHLNPWVRPLPMLYESTGVESQFTNRLDPEPRSRRVFAFHRPETLLQWVSPLAAPLPEEMRRAAEDSPLYDSTWTFRRRLRSMPPLDTTGLWPAQITAIENLERSLAEDRPRALVQMATGSGKTFTAISSIYRLIKYGGATRVLFLVDRANLGRQALKEFQQYVTPDDGRKFTELYNVQLLQSNRIDPVARVVITTIQRLYSMLRGDEAIEQDLEEGSLFDSVRFLETKPVMVTYNPDVPVETFDVIFTDECHRSIYNVWRQVLEYFDATLIGLTATPSKQTLGFFNQNLVMEYDHARAVADGVNVDFDIYEIRTKISEQGSTVEAGLYVDKRDRLTRQERWEELEEELTYGAKQLDRDVVAEDQLRTVIRTFKERLFTEIMPGRSEVPKTLIFAKDDSHADDIVKMVRLEFGKGNDFCQKITYRTTGDKPENLLAAFRNSYEPRIVVTVDMIATGTDIKPLEIVMFLRAVKSRTYFEQMKGRGVRVINPTDLQQVTPDATSKSHFVLVDCVGISTEEMIDQPPLERNPFTSLDTLLKRIAFGGTDQNDLSSLASRLARLDRELAPAQRQELTELNGGEPISEMAHRIVDALDPDRQIEAARDAFDLGPETEPSDAQLEEVRSELLRAAAMPLACNPGLRNRLVEIRRQTEQTIDRLSQDEVTRAGYAIAATDRAKQTVDSWEAFIEANKEELTALQILYSRPYREGLRLKDVKELAARIEAPPLGLTTDRLWEAYQELDRSRVRGSGARVVADLVSLVRFALHQENELAPYPEAVQARFEAWLADQESHGRRFTAEQRQWLEAIRDHIATSLRIERDDFDQTPFSEKGGLGRFYEVFGEEMDRVIEELNEVLAA